jgi:benzylsuccinate CoA-transferase BbsF subunit
MGKSALEGVKILDFGWVMSGASIGKHLADNGATVIRVETASRPCSLRTDRQISVSTATSLDDKPVFTWFNTSKLSLSLNMRHSRSREVLDRLVRWADVVSENYTPGTMNKLGLGYEQLSRLKPEIIMVGSSAFGQTGPLSREWGMDGSALTLSGRLYLTGWPDQEPVMTTCSPFADIVTPVFATTAVVAALDYRRRTGKGQYIDVSMIEICSRSIAPAILDWAANKNLEKRTGNRIPNAAPHGVFPCQGNDRWVAIAVFTEEEWQAFCGVLGSPDWSKAERFSSLEFRKKNEDQLERLTGEWTRLYPPEEVMQLMQKAGVASGVVQNPQDILEKDPQLKDREFIKNLKHPVLGEFGHITPAYQLSKTPANVKTSPCLGEHTEYICTELLGMQEMDYICLFARRGFLLIVR